jgi:hypothetical protein
LSQNNVHTFTLSWTDNSSSEDGFAIERKIDSGTFAEIGRTALTNYIDDQLTKGYGTVYYQVRAYKGDNYSNYAIQSMSVSFPAPTDLSVTQNRVCEFVLNWTDNSTGEEKFEIERKLSTETSYLKVGEALANEEQWTDTDVAPYLTYDYRVKAVKGGNSSNYTTKTNTYNDFPSPTDLSYTKPDIKTVSLLWTDNSSGEEGFRIDKKVGTAEWQLSFAAVAANVTSWSDTSAEINQNIEYRIYAYKGSNSSSSLTTPSIDTTFPVPTNLSTTQVSITEAIISWTDNSIGEEKFEIERKLSIGSIYSKIAEVVGSDTGTKTWNDTTVEPGLTYDYRVRGLKGADTSVYVARQYFNEFHAPINLNGTPSSRTTLELTWGYNNDGIQGYYIDRKVGLNGEWVSRYASITGSNTSYTDTNYDSEETYYYRIRAYYQELESNNSTQLDQIGTFKRHTD